MQFLVTVILTLWVSWARGQETCLNSKIKIENGFIAEPESTYLLNQKVKYKCKQDYVTEDGQTSGYITCLQNGWSAQPRCIKSCGVPVFENARAKSDGTWFKVNDRLAYECQDGYKNRDGHTVGSIVCGENGWSDTPACQERECIVPDIEQNLIAQPLKEKYVIGDVLKFSCRSRFLTLIGPDTLQCYHFGWSSSPPTCKEEVQSCDQPPRLRNGKVADTPKWKYEHGEVVEYVCNPRFLLKGARRIQCVDGEWTPLPVCVEEDSTCGDVPELDHGEVVSPARPPYHHGESVEFTCGEGFTMTGHSSVTCIRGTWTQPPQCIERECIVPDIEQNLIAQPLKEKYVIGDVLKFSCRNRFLTLIGPDTLQCYHFGWSPSPPTCKEEVQSCDQPPRLRNGKVADTPKWKYEHGEVVEYVCNPRFLLKGARKIQCVDGEWTPLPVCVEEDSTCGDVPELDHGEVVSPARPPYHHGESVEFTCGEGFTMTGHSSVTCIRGTWTQPPQCIAISCSLPQIPNGEPRSFKTSFRDNERLQYRCLPGYSYSGRAETVCTQLGWSPPPSCREMTCDPPRIANSHFVADRSRYNLGDTLTYSCTSGFFPSSRGNTATCTDKGWDPPPRCSDKPCDFPEIKHGSLRWGDWYRSQFPVSVGQSYHYYCDDSYVAPSGGKWDRMTCTRDGWTPKVPCRRKCIFNDLENGHRPPHEESYLQGTSVSVNCHPGYTLQNEQTSMTCTENGWFPPPRCIRVDLSCGSPPPVQNASIPNEMRRYQHGDTARYECRHPLGLFGNAEVTCLSGKWTDPPECKEPKGKCGPPPAVDNGDVTTYPLAVYPPGSSVEYQCQSYYELEGNKRITCRDGQWSEPPKCLDACVISEEIMKEHNIELKWSYAKKIYIRTNDYVEFRCHQGYYRKLSPDSAFRAQCREGKLEFPSCA